MNKDIKIYLDPGKKNLVLIYVLYLGGVILPLLPIIGAAFAFANQNYKEEIWRGHYIFAFRTFIFGMIGAFIAMITTVVFIGPIIYVLMFTWLVARSIIAIQYILGENPHPNPSSFWIQ